MRDRRPPLLFACCLAGCYSAGPVDEPPPPSVVFTYPVDNQLDVPLGARVLVSYSDAVADQAGCTLAGPDGNVEITKQVVGHGKTVAITSSALLPLTTYQVTCGGSGELAGEPLFRFTTRNDRPLAGAPSLIAVNGSALATLDALHPGAFRPIFESSTLQLVFSEPLDPRSVTTDNGAVELVDANGAPVPATLLANGIHVTLDPAAPLAAGATYQLRLGNQLADVGGERLVPTAIAFTPLDSLGRGPIRQVFRTWQSGDPVASVARTDDMNVMAVSHPLIGEANAAMKPNVLETELGDPLALDGPIAFRIPKGQRLTSAGLAIQLAGAIPSGLETGDIAIEMLTDGGGRLYRNRYQPAGTLPDNTTSPLLVDLSFDLAIYATDPTGNAVLAQTVLGIQLTGLAIADEGALAIETLGALDINLLGMSSAPTNIVLDLISDLKASPAPDVQPPTLLSSLPAADSHDLITDEGIELVFDEPVDIDRARAGAITLRDGNTVVPSSLEIHGSVVVVRPRATLLGNHAYQVDLSEVGDLAGNVMPLQTFAIATQLVAQTDVPPSVTAVYPGAPCSLVDVKTNTAGRCSGGASADDRYRPFALAANERIAVVFDQPLYGASLTLGDACNTGSIRVERVDAMGTCLEAVPGTLVKHQRDIGFIPDGGWRPGEHYQLRLVSGPNATCDVGEVCGANGRPANFDPLGGTTASASGGPDLLVSFVGTDPTKATTLLATASPNTDLNGSGRMEQGEQLREDNRVALRIAGATGLISSASFQGPDCMPSTPEVESCMYVAGAIPAQLGERRENCILPGGTMVPTCIPVAMSAQAMYSTSVTMTAGALGILPITTETGMSVMRVRENPDGPLEGYIVDRNGTPTMIAALGLYMDAPDMSLPIAQHDMHSKPLWVTLEGPLQFKPDGRIAISLRNIADVPISVGIDAPLGIKGAVQLIVPAGEMRLQLMSRAQRGSLP
ncbi:MAG TPA: Ig-like domain-containing protein [Kofleriaceae bacterium]|nr:Ig-like domain-containing protein [Kofleriaceae bacterium]